MPSAGVALAAKFCEAELSAKIVSASQADIETMIEQVMGEHEKDCSCTFADGGVERVKAQYARLEQFRSEHPIEFIDALHVAIEREEQR